MSAKTTNVLLALAIATSVGSLAVSLFPEKTSHYDEAKAERIEALERELAHLKGRIYRETNLEDLELEEASDESLVLYLNPDYEGSSHAASVERDVDDMRWTMTLRGLMPPTEGHIMRSKEIIFSGQKEVKEKLAALRILRSAKERSDDVVLKMIDEFHKTSDEDMKAEILNHLDDVKTPELVQVLLEASSQSRSARVRREAVDSLSGFLPDPDLMDWLSYVETNDTEKRVRKEATRLIKKFGSN